MAETLQQYKKRVASAGGRAVVAKRGKGYMRRIAQKGLAKRWHKRGIIRKVLFD